MGIAESGVGRDAIGPNMLPHTSCKSLAVVAIDEPWDWSSCAMIKTVREPRWMRLDG